MRNSTGATEEAFGKLQTKSDAFKKTFNELKNVMIELGDALLEVLAPIIEAVVEKVKEFSEWFSGLSDETKKVIAVVTIVGAVLAPVLIIIGKLITAIGTIVKVVGMIAGVSTPVIAIIAGIAAAIAGIILVIRNWGDITEWLSEKWNALKDWMSGLWDSISEKIQEVWNGIKDFFADIWEQIYNVIEGPLKFIEGTIGAVMYAIQAVIVTIWEVIRIALEKVWNWISDTASAIFIPVANFFSGIWNGIKDTATGIWNSIKDTLGGIWDSIKEKAMDAFSSVWKFIKDGFNDLKDTLGGIVKKIAQAIVDPIGNAVNGVIRGVNWILDAIGSDMRFDEWSVPKFASGTGGLPRDTIGVVNDQKGSTYKEMIIPPNGKPFIPEGRDVVLPMKKGTKIMPANQTKSFLEELPHFASGIGDFFGGIWDTVKDFTGSVWDYITHPSKIVQIAIDKFTDLTGAFEPWITVAKGAVNTVFDSVVGFVKGMFDKQTHVDYNPSAGVEQWRTLAIRALQMTGQYSEANLERLLYQMQTESGGNPNAVNNWDINAINGTPSKGLMQVIDPTFRAYAMPGYDQNIFDPLSNMLASIRYAVSRYGSLAAAYRGVGYEEGVGKIDLSDFLPSLPMLDIQWFQDGGILTKPALFKMPSGKIGGAAEREAEAITPLKSLKGFIKESILEIMGEKDINLNINLTTTLDGRVVAQQTVGYARPMIKKMNDFEKLLGGERIGNT